jgi:hypothetical protein
MSNRQEERLIEQGGTYTLEIKDRSYVIEYVPARVDEETGEQFFAPSMMKRLQETISEQAQLNRLIETLVYEYNE